MFRYTHPNRERFDREGWPGDNIERLREQVEEQMRGSPGLSKWGEALLAVKCADPPVQHRAEDWPANLAAFRQVSDEMERFNTTRGHTDGEGNEISGRFADAMNAALLTPAPDFAALATKAAIYDAHEVDDGWHMAREITKLLAQDAARLAWQSGLAVFETATAALKDCREDEEIDAVADAQLEAIVSLLLTPAPDAAALSRKLEIVRAETAWGMNEGKAIMESFAEDQRRLTGAAVTMASHHIDAGRASALPLHLLAQTIPMLTRNELASLTERLIERLDEQDGDPDAEDDDPDAEHDGREAS